jgi:hypothetical protein
MEPYVRQDGTVWGEEPTKSPAPATTRSWSATSRGRDQNNLARRARLARERAKVDPQWAERSPESRRRLLDLDVQEGR